MSRKKILMATAWLLSVCLLSFTGTSRASAHMEHHGMMMMHGGPIPFYLMNQDRLGLTKEQVTKLVKLKENFMKTTIMEHARIRVLHMDIMEDMMHRKIDTGDVKKDMDKILAHKKMIMHGYLDMISRAHLVLTARQYEKVKSLWREMMMMHHGMMMGHHHDMMEHHPHM